MLFKRLFNFGLDVISPTHRFVSALLNRLFVLADRGALKKEAEASNSYLEEATVYVSAPDYRVQETPNRLLQHIGEYYRDKPEVFIVRDADLVGSVGVPVYGKHSIPLEAFGAGRHKFELYLRSDLGAFRSLLRYRAGKRDQDVKVVDHAISLATIKTRSQDYGFFNWMQWALPMLIAINHMHESTTNQPTVIVRPDPPAWVVQYLRLLGYSDKNVQEWDGELTNIDSLLLPTVPTGEYAPSSPTPPTFRDDHLKLMHPGVCGLVRDKMRLAAENEEGSESRQFHERVFISRQQATTGRSVSNFEELENFLEDQQFHVCEFEKMAVSDQIMTMTHAEVILAPHGAGLANMIYSEDATILELLGNRKRKATFFVMAKALGHDYGFLLCNNAGDDIVVDIKKLEELLGSADLIKGNTD